MLNVLEAYLVMNRIIFLLLVVENVRYPPKMYRLLILQTFSQFHGRTDPFAVGYKHINAPVNIISLLILTAYIIGFNH